MQSAYLRTFVSGLVTACFALSVMTRAAMPGCVSATGNTPAAHAPGSHHDHPHHSPGSGNQSSCPLHLCCANVSAAPEPGISTVVLLPAPELAGFIAPSAPVEDQPAHLLPFATAPPLSAT